MEKMLTVAFLVALSVSVAAQSQGTIEDLKINAGSTYVSLNAKGTMTISKQSDIVNDANKIVAKIHKLESISSDGSIVNVNLSTLNLVARGRPVSTADALNLTVINSNSLIGEMFSIVFTIAKNKNVVIGDERTSLTTGDIGIQFKLSGYTRTTEDNRLKMTLMIKGKSASPTEITTNKDKDSLAYDLGGNGVLKLSKKVKLGNEIKNVNVTAKEDKFTMEFTKGDRYTIVIKPADVPSTGSGRGDGFTKSTSLGVAMMAILVLLYTV